MPFDSYTCWRAHAGSFSTQCTSPRPIRTTTTPLPWRTASVPPARALFPTSSWPTLPLQTPLPHATHRHRHIRRPKPPPPRPPDTSSQQPPSLPLNNNSPSSQIHQPRLPQAHPHPSTTHTHPPKLTRTAKWPPSKRIKAAARRRPAPAHSPPAASRTR